MAWAWSCAGRLFAPDRIRGMQLRDIAVPVGSVFLVAAAYRMYGWSGVALAVGGVVMWVLLHFTRLLQVLRRAAQRPMGSVDSAVMLNAKLRAGVPLLHVLALTRALGTLQSSQDTQPEVFRWTDNTGSHVTCEFHEGKLKKWVLERPESPGS